MEPVEKSIIHASDPAPVSMSNDWFGIASEDHFWFRWRLAALVRMGSCLPDRGQRVLEVGCGSGVFRQQLEGLGYTVDGCDLNLSALEMATPGVGNLYVYDINERHESLIGRYHGVFLMDVIEHIDDDIGFLVASADHLVGSGVVVINVPSLPGLFSRYDEAVGHVRRYSKDTLAATIKSAGLVPLSLRYWGLSMVPLLALRKLLVRSRVDADVIRRGLAPPSPLIHGLLSLVGRLETSVPVTPPIGTSVLAIARRS